MELARATFPPLATSAAEVRAWIGALVTSSLDPVALDVALVVASELVTNAYRHGEGVIDVTVKLDPTCLRLSVSDSGAVFVVPEHGTMADEGGRGLQVVAGLSTRWGIDTFAGG